MKCILKSIVALLTLSIAPIIKANRLTYYRTPNWVSEPRLTNPYLSSASLYIGAGDTRLGYNQHGQEVGLLNRFGEENFRAIAQGVPSSILNQNNNHILDDLAILSEPDFGKIKFTGDFKFTEFNLKLIQNWKYGFYTELNVPFRKFTLNNLNYLDQSNLDQIGSANATDWRNLTNNLIANLKKYDITIDNSNFSTVGDLTLELGWTESHTNTRYLDYWDTEIKIGVIIPTARHNCYHCPLLINPGYDGATGFPLSFNIAAGAYEWLTIGTQITGILFPEHTKIMGIKTDLNQTGLIRLASSTVNLEPGNIWGFATYLKADHLAWGFSAALGYQFSKQQKTRLVLPNGSPFDCHIANTDAKLQGWHMHTINLNLECDFASDLNHQYYPQINLTFDLPFSGKYCLRNKMIGGTIEFNIDW